MKRKTTFFSVNLMRSQVLYRAAQSVSCTAGSAGGGITCVFSQPFRLYRCVRVVSNLAVQLVVSGLAVVRGVRVVQEARRRQKELEQVERQNAAAVVASPGPQAPPHFPAPTARPHSARSARFAEGAKLIFCCHSSGCSWWMGSSWHKHWTFSFETVPL